MAEPQRPDGKAARARLVFPLDYPTLARATAGAKQVHESVGVLKVGLELFVAEGPPSIRLGAELGCDVFLDLKLHDIPETVERAVAAAGQLGVRYLTVHTSGGPRMLEAAALRVERDRTGVQLLGVTLLTSLDGADLQRMGISASPAEQAVRLARMAREVGINGFVCSVAELRPLRAELGDGAVLVTPGIRPKQSATADDQKRIGTPSDAIRAGATLLVVGRPIRDAADPRAAAASVAREIAEAMRDEPVPT
jgi:orotidine-5'-phosphate decarboxylase